jgi:hypothetical protein
VEGSCDQHVQVFPDQSHQWHTQWEYTFMTWFQPNSWCPHLSIFCSTQQMIQDTLLGHRIEGDRKWKAGVDRWKYHGPLTPRRTVSSLASLVSFLLFLSFSMPLPLHRLCFGPVGHPQACLAWQGHRVWSVANHIELGPQSHSIPNTPCLSFPPLLPTFLSPHQGLSIFGDVHSCIKMFYLQNTFKPLEDGQGILYPFSRLIKWIWKTA